RPRVVVQETRVERPLRLSAVAAPPVVASFFVPMPLNVGVVGGAVSHSLVEDRRDTAQTISLDSPGLRAAHELEQSRLQMEKLQALHDAEYRHMRSVLERAAPLRETAPSATCCDDIKKDLMNLKSRVEQLEQIVIYH